MGVVEIVTGLVMVVGLAGTLLPILPGLALIWAAGVVYGLIEGFGVAGIAAMTLMTVFVGVGLWLGLRIPQRRTADVGVGFGTQLIALGLAIVGFFVIPVVGAAVGFVMGILLVQWARTRDWGEAWLATKVGVGAMFRVSAAQFGVGASMILVWWIWALVGS